MTENNQAKPANYWPKIKPTALLIFADGTILEGKGVGAYGTIEGEICFNTAITGYQEILTDPSYTGQIVTFTFPHIGNVGVNDEDIEILNPVQRFGAVGTIFRADISDPDNYRAITGMNEWLKLRNIVGITSIDTRALTILLRDQGSINALLAHNPTGHFDLDALKQRAASWHGLKGFDLAQTVSCGQSQQWKETPWVREIGYGEQKSSNYHIIVIDYGIKRNILRLLAALDAKITIVPAHMSAEDILSQQPDGIFLSNGPGDPEATGLYAVPTIRKLIASHIPLFGICLGHQLLALAAHAKTLKMHQGHHGANHPVKHISTNKVEIVSMNHGFAVDATTFPPNIEQTHISLFDGSNCGLRMLDHPVFSVQHHPEASPGPQDSHYLFYQFLDLIKQHKNGTIEFQSNHDSINKG